MGSNDVPRKYRINRAIEDEINDQTALFLNYRLSTLGVQGFYASSTYAVGGDFDNVDLGLRVVSHFKDAYWKSGLWTNGIFDGNKFDQGIWYNGIFDGIRNKKYPKYILNIEGEIDPSLADELKLTKSGKKYIKYIE